VLFAVPGIPSVYYGSEFGLEGVKTHEDWNLRLFFDLDRLRSHAPQPDLTAWIQKLVGIRENSAALRTGSYVQRLVASDQFGFSRHAQGEDVLVLVNNADAAAAVNVAMPGYSGRSFSDLLTPGEAFAADTRGNLTVLLHPKSARIMRAD